MSAPIIDWLRVDTHHPRTLYADVTPRCAPPGAPGTCGASRFLRSRDGGVTWTDLTLALDVDPRWDAGWSPLLIAPDGRHLYFLVSVEGVSPNGSYLRLDVSADGGESWTPQFSDQDTYGGGYWDIALSPAAPGRVYALIAGSQGGPLRVDVSDDGGLTWRKGSTPPPKVYGFMGPAFLADPARRATVYVTASDPTTHQTIALRSDDAGVTWAPLPRTLPLMAPTPTATATPGAPATSRNTPTPTAPSTPPGSPTPILAAQFALSVDPHEGTAIVARSLDPTVPSNRRYLSTDQGQTWHAATCPGDLHGTCPAFTLDNLFGAGASYALLPDGIYRFHAGGPAEERLALSDSLPFALRGLVDVGGGTHAGDPVYVVSQSSQESRLWTSGDGGQSWHDLMPAMLPALFPPPPPPLAHHLAGASGTVYAGAHHGTVAALDAFTGKVRWSVQTGTTAESPVVAQGAAYFWHGGSEPTLEAVDARTGSLLWRVPVAGAAAPLQNEDITVEDGVVYVATASGRQGSGSGHFRALDARTGHQLWSVGSAVYTRCAPLPEAASVGCLDLAKHAYTILAARTGQPRWSVPLPANVVPFCTPSGVVPPPPAPPRRTPAAPPQIASSCNQFGYMITPVPGRVVITGPNAVLAVLDTHNGRRLWSTRLPAPFSDVTVAGTILYAATAITGSGSLALQAFAVQSGALLWQTTTHGDPLVHGSTVYVVQQAHNVIAALNARTGQALWTARAPYGGVPESITGGVLVVTQGETSGYREGFDAATGQVVWRSALKETLFTPMATGAGAVYLMADHRTVVALDAHTWTQLWQTTTGTAQGDTDLGTTPVVEVHTPVDGVAAGECGPAAACRPGARYFPQTQHHLSGAFLAYWQANGGLDAFGFPRTEPFSDGGHQVQYTDRFALERAGGQVVTLPLGQWLTAGRTFTRATPAAGALYFSSTGHTLSGMFLTYWRNHHGAVLLGPPIAEPDHEMNGDGSGRTYLVQWFANGRLEYHPDLAGTPYIVELGLAGTEDLRWQGWLP